MQNIDSWKPTKADRTPKGFAPSRDPKMVAVSSRIAAALQISQYEVAIRQHASGRLLDMGCGFVPYFEMYRDLTTEVTCIDWDNSRHKSTLLDQTVNLNEPLPLDSALFDTVLLTDVLEHIARPFELCLEIQRVLAIGGKVIIGVPFLYWIHEQPYDFHRYTEFALRRMCESAGLEVLSITPYGGAPEVLADITCKCVAAGGAFLAKVYTAICAAGLQSGLVRKVSRRTARLFPLGYVAVAQRRDEPVVCDGANPRGE